MKRLLVPIFILPVICFSLSSCTKEAPIEASFDQRLIGVWKSSSISFDSKESSNDNYYTTYTGDITMNIFSSGTIYAEFIYNYTTYYNNNVDLSGEGFQSESRDFQTLDNSRINVDGQMFDYSLSGVANDNISFTTNSIYSWNLFGDSDWIHPELNEGYLAIIPRSFTKQ